MDRFGFNKLSKAIQSSTPIFLEKGIKLAQEEMKENFESESNAESNQSWNEISYRDVPPPILDLTGQLKEEALNNHPIILGNKGILTIDPIDSRGKGYASYHQDGENQYRDKSEFQREFVTQSEKLAQKQVNLLESLVNNAIVNS